MHGHLTPGGTGLGDRVEVAFDTPLNLPSTAAALKSLIVVHQGDASGPIAPGTVTPI